MNYVELGLVAGVIIVGGGLYTNYNRLIALDERCNTAFSDIDVQLKHRHSVVPMLVETVKGFAGHESDILQSVSNARANALAAASPEMRLQAETQLGQALTSLISIEEKYPDLKASSHFRELRIELSDVENRITASRRFFNLTVDEFNSSVRQFPGNLIGSLASLSRRQHFSLGAERMLIEEPVMFSMRS